jgi:hypothetical protein
MKIYMKKAIASQYIYLQLIDFRAGYTIFIINFLSVINFLAPNIGLVFF